MRKVVWVGSSYRDFQDFPHLVRRAVGYSLYLVQNDEIPGNAKVLTGMGSAGVREIRQNDSSGTYRVVCLVTMAKYVFVLHAFQKKSTLGIATPRQEIATMKARLKEAMVIYKTLIAEDK